MSAESSYVEGPWTTQPVQVAVLNAMGNDDIREVAFRKSARIGYTKMLLAATLYLAEHKKRNIGIWREDDTAAAEFVTLELDPAMRDCKPIAAIFPDLGKKSEKNKQDEKHLIGCAIHIRGGHSAGGYRALSKDVVIGDEIDGFVQNTQGKGSKEGNPLLLMLKRLVGSAFPKAIFGTTPTVSGSSHIEKREKAADCRLHCYIPCPHCDEYQYLKFGNGKERFGFRWDDNDPETVRYACEHCENEFEYGDYLDVQSRCIWRDMDEDIETKDGLFFYSISTGRERTTPKRVCFIAWAAYSPTSPWSQIVDEWLTSKDDKNNLQVFVNTTLGEYWHEGVVKKMDGDHLYRRREYYPKDSSGAIVLPNDVLYLTAGVDTQDNRYAYEIVGWGKNKQNWSVEYKEIMGRPDDPEIRQILVENLRRKFKRADGLQLEVSMVFHDAGGSYFDTVLQHAAETDPYWWIACMGNFQIGVSYVVASKSAKAREYGANLYQIGTTRIGDLVERQFNTVEPAPICHWPISTPEDPVYTGHDKRYFEMLTAEQRILKRVKGKDVWLWDCPSGKRNEAWDCRRYATAALIYAEQYAGIDLNHYTVQIAQSTEPEPNDYETAIEDYWGG